MTIARLAQALGEQALAPTGEVPTTAWGASLTRRELSVAVAAARGMATRDIAAQLYVSPRTVEHHLLRIYQKFAISSRAQLCALVIDHLVAERAS